MIMVLNFLFSSVLACVPLNFFLFCWYVLVNEFKSILSNVLVSSLGFYVSLSVLCLFVTRIDGFLGYWFPSSYYGFFYDYSSQEA